MNISVILYALHPFPFECYTDFMRIKDSLYSHRPLHASTTFNSSHKPSFDIFTCTLHCYKAGPSVRREGEAKEWLQQWKLMGVTKLRSRSLVALLSASGRLFRAKRLATSKIDGCFLRRILHWSHMLYIPKWIIFVTLSKHIMLPDMVIVILETYGHNLCLQQICHICRYLPQAYVMAGFGK